MTAMVAGQETGELTMMAGDQGSTIVDFRSVNRLPIEVRRRLARRRRRVLNLRDLLAMTAVSGAAALLLTIALFSLIIGR